MYADPVAQSKISGFHNNWTRPVSTIDGHRATAQILIRLTDGTDSPTQKQLATEAITTSLRILHTDAAIELWPSPDR